jgi:hypothetical protein
LAGAASLHAKTCAGASWRESTEIALKNCSSLVKWLFLMSFMLPTELFSAQNLAPNTHWYRLEVVDLSGARIKVGRAEVKGQATDNGKVWESQEEVQLKIYSLGKISNLSFEHVFNERILADGSAQAMRFRTIATKPSRFQLTGEFTGKQLHLHWLGAGGREFRKTEILLEAPLFARAMSAQTNTEAQKARLNPMTGRVDTVIGANALQPGEFIRQYVNAEIIFVPATQIEANAPDTAFSPLALQAMRSPYAITKAALKGKIRYRLSIPEALGITKLQLPGTDEQEVIPALGTRAATVTVLEICARCGQANSTLARPTQAELELALEPNPWSDNADASVRRLSARLGGSALSTSRDFFADSPKRINAKMRHLVAGLTQYMTGEISYFGHQTATQTVRSRSGDCGEMALLLAALAKARGIPSRVVSGLAYTRSFEGQAYVFAPHVWVQAWNGQYWRSFDAALGEFNAGHIALTISDGAPPIAPTSASPAQGNQAALWNQVVQMARIRKALVLEAAGSLPSP